MGKNLKTIKRDSSVKLYLEAIDNQRIRKESFIIKKLMQEVTGRRAKMWGQSIIGFGSYKYQYKSGKSGEWMLTGFAPRKTNFSIYVMSGFSGMSTLLSKLGKHKLGKSCLYVKSIEDIDLNILKNILTLSVKKMERKC